MSIATSRGKVAQPNVVAVRMRQARGWSQRRLACEFQDLGRRRDDPLPVPGDLSTIVKQISRIERGVTETPDPMYLRLWCDAFKVDAAELFGHPGTPVVAADGRATFAVTSHKFIPAYLGCDGVKAIRALGQPAAGQWVDCHRAPLEHPAGQATAYGWPFGVAVVHLVEELEFASLGQLAVWRRNSYPQARDWADGALRELTDRPAATVYVLSAFWLTRAKWQGDQLDTAMRLLSMPSVLLDREEEAVDEESLLCGAEQVERALLQRGEVDRADLVAFGSSGVSVGYASWSGVAYHPIAPKRSLSVDEMVSCELLTQAMWCYTHEIQRQVETGQDPIVPVDYGFKFLRGAESRLNRARAIESGQHAGMREAVLSTSGLTQQLESAKNALRESGRGA